MPVLKTKAPNLDNIEAWIDSEPVNLEKGVYLIYFWNYSCGCCRNRLEVFHRIHEEYSSFKVVGVRLPRFDFERNERNLEKAVEKLEINHPIAHDPTGEVFDQYNLAGLNHVVLVDRGSVAHQQSSIADIEMLEKKISDVLGIEGKEMKSSKIKSDQNTASHIYLGYSRSEGFNGEGNHPGRKKYRIPESRKSNTVYLKGTWNQKENYIESDKDSELRFKSELSELNLIIDSNNSLRDIKVLVDGENVSERFPGKDLRLENGESYVRVNNPDLYNLIDSEGVNSEITLIPEKGTRLYALSVR